MCLLLILLMILLFDIGVINDIVVILNDTEVIVNDIVFNFVLVQLLQLLVN